MNKLTKKFIWGISVIVCFAILISLIMNLFLVEPYYIYQKKQDIENICTRLESAIGQGATPEAAMEELEKAEEVVIVKVEPDSDTDRLNEALRTDFREKGIGFQRFWLWEEDYQETLKNGRKLRIYKQEKLNYSIMAEYMQSDKGFFAMAMIIPDMSDAIRIINTCMTTILAVTLLLACFSVAFLVQKIIKPLEKMKQQADDIADQSFYSVEIKTNDELEVVADSMNLMCKKIQDYQQELADKNRQMERLLDDVAHELKTPVALVKAYADGIKDGLDDGTFLDTIISKNNNMEEIIEKLLVLSRMKQKELMIERLDLAAILNQIMEEQLVLAKSSGISLQSNIVSLPVMEGSLEMITLIFSNLVTNAIKYTVGDTIDITLQPCENGYKFEIKNDTDADIDLSRIWTPFYVGEESRNKILSGTGLGLAIVQKSGAQMGYPVSCRLEGKKIVFCVIFPMN